MSAPVLVCFAVRHEAGPFQNLIRGHHDVRVLITGMGARNAEREVRDALDSISPRIVFSSGFTGALNPDLRVGDVLFDVATTRSELFPRLKSLGAQPATFLCDERVAITVQEKLTLRARSGSDAVEMESKIISEVCASHGIECMTLRAVSDSAHEDLPLDFNALMTSEQRLSPARLAFAIARAPHKIPALVRLGKNSTRAAEQLARVLSALV